MALTPSQYIDCYLPITVPTIVTSGSGFKEGPLESVHVSKYVNFGLKAQFAANAITRKDELIGFLRQKAAKKDSGVRPTSVKAVWGIDMPEANPPIYGFPYSRLMDAVTGKVTADQMLTVLRLVSYWMSTKPKSLNGVPTLQKFADLYLGLDCNGYTGAYFQSQHPELGIVPNTLISEYERRGIARKSLEEVRRCDVLVFPGHVHIALADQIQNVVQGKLKLNICQSRSYTLGGVQSSPAELTIDKMKQFALDGRPLKAVVGMALR